MQVKNGIKVIIITVILLIITILGWRIYKNRNLPKIHQQKNSDSVVNKHINEFNIIESNYIEKYYERYIAYKKKHVELEDDKIITYVNIGLDNNFYTNMEKTNMGDGYLIICNKYHQLASDYVPDLVSLAGYGGGQMERVAAKNFKEMSDAANIIN